VSYRRQKGTKRWTYVTGPVSRKGGEGRKKGYRRNRVGEGHNQTFYIRKGELTQKKGKSNRKVEGGLPPPLLKKKKGFLPGHPKRRSGGGDQMFKKETKKRRRGKNWEKKGQAHAVLDEMGYEGRSLTCHEKGLNGREPSRFQ